MALPEDGQDYQFENSIADCLQCAICLNQLEEPMQCVRHEHSFCNLCIRRHLAVNQRSCPNCKEPLTFETLRPARLVANLLSQLKMPCEYAERGCNEIVRREILPAHIRDCGFSPVQCSNFGCVEVMNRNEKACHEGNECDFRKAKCEVCDEDVPFRSAKLHCYVKREEMTRSWEYNMACIQGKFEKAVNDFAVQMEDITTNMNAMRAEMNHTTSELKLDLSAMSNTTDEVKAEIRCTRFSTHVVQKKIEVMNVQIGDMSDHVVQLRNQVGALSESNDDRKREINEMCAAAAREGCGDRDLRSEINALRQSLLCFKQNVNTREQIIVAGGQDNKHALNSVEVFSWADRRWSSLNPMSLSRSTASSFTYDRQMVISGGVSEDGERPLGMECLPFSDLSSQWHIFPSRFPRQYRRHTCIVYKNDVFVIGGRDSEKTCSGVYKMSLNTPPHTLELVCNMPEPRQGHGAELFGDYIIVVGGTSGVSRTCLDSVLCFDIKRNTFKTLAARLPIALTSMATVLWKDNVIIIGGRDNSNEEKKDVMIYNITNESCTTMPEPMKHRRSGCTAVVEGDVVVVMGGRNREEGYLNSVEMFSFDQYRWQDLPPMGDKRWYATAVVRQSCDI